MNWLREPSDGDTDALLWIMLPGYICLDQAGQQKRWPLTYEGDPPRLFGYNDPPRWLLLTLYFSTVIGVLAALFVIVWVAS